MGRVNMGTTFLDKIPTNPSEDSCNAVDMVKSRSLVTIQQETLLLKMSVVDLEHEVNNGWWHSSFVAVATAYCCYVHI
jgi:hypothetical protein